MENTVKSRSEKTSESENIIVWLDFNAYAYTNFGIISALSKLDEFNFIGIVADKHDMGFFQNQQIISFKELVYYPDSYIHKPIFNLDNLNKFEKLYDLNIWLDAYTERYFYKYLDDFHKFSKEEILSIIENSISFFVDILEKYKPKLILMQQAGENISNLLLYRIAKKMKIKVLMPVPIHMHNTFIMSDNIGGREICDGFKKLMSNVTNESKIYDENFIKKSNMIETINVQLKYNYNTSTFSQKINHYIKRLSHNPEPIYKDVGKTKLKVIRYKLQKYFEIKKRQKFLNNKSIKTVEDKKFIYYPLHSEPEAKILVETPFHSNQIALIENIARSIPVDSVLYVKEHPVQKTKLWRSVEDYKKIITMPNVKLVHPDLNSQELISKSQGIVVISGAVGFEALFYKKPIILFGDEYYDELSMVTKIATLTTLPNVINNALSNFKFNNNELNALMQTINEQTISVSYFSIIKDGVVLSSIQRNGNDFNLTIKHFQEFYNIHKNDFELIAQTIYSKLKI
jgi:hypothetical protein